MAELPKFPPFDSFVCHGETVTMKYTGCTCTARVEHDMEQREPWENSDCYGIVSKWTSRTKSPGERILCSDHNAHRYYDVAATMEKAKREGWSVGDDTLSAAENAARAVARDFEVLKAWCDDEWWYCGIVVTVTLDGVELGEASVWGIEANYPDSKNEYLSEVANDLLHEAIAEAKEYRDDLADKLNRLAFPE